MDIFRKAKTVRLRSHHDKYLLADDDQEGVSQDRNGNIKNAKWTVEILESENVIRLKSCHGKYLTASNVPFLFGMRGRKVIQTVPRRLDSSVEWEPVRDGVQVRLKTRYGQFLRANGGVPPWRNQITHDVPHRSGTTIRDWVLWDVDVLEVRKASDAPPLPSNSLRWPAAADVVSQPPLKEEQNKHHIITPPPFPPVNTFGEDTYLNPYSPSSSSLLHSHKPSKSSDTICGKNEGRMIYYNVANKDGVVEEEEEELCFTFKGSGVEELKQKLEEETRLFDVLVCSRNPLNGKLYPLKLQLPPNNTDMHIVVVPSSAKVTSNIVLPESSTST